MLFDLTTQPIGILAHEMPDRVVFRCLSLGLRQVVSWVHDKKESLTPDAVFVRGDKSLLEFALPLHRHYTHSTLANIFEAESVLAGPKEIVIQQIRFSLLFKKRTPDGRQVLKITIYNLENPNKAIAVVFCEVDRGYLLEDELQNLPLNRAKKEATLKGDYEEEINVPKGTVWDRIRDDD